MNAQPIHKLYSQGTERFKNTDAAYARIHRQAIYWGVWFGLSMGLAFAATAWGREAYLLNAAGMDRPWLHLAIGLGFGLPLAALAGWLTSWSDRATVGIVCWLATAVALNWLMGHTPYELSSWLLAQLEPDFAGLTVYPLPESAGARLGISMFASAVLFAIGGGLQSMVVDSVRTQPSLPRRLLSLSFCMPLFLLAGGFADEVINRPLRQPVLAVSELIHLKRETLGQALDPQYKRLQRLGVLDSVSEWVERPYRLIVGDYESMSLDTVRVLVDFDGQWARCSVLAEQPSFCQPSQVYYLRALDCLRRDAACTVQASPAARSWLSQTQPAEEIGNGQVLNQYGVLTWIGFELSGESYRCLFNAMPALKLEQCTGGAALPAAAALNPTAPAAANTPEAGPAETHWPRYALQLKLDPAQAAFQASGTLTYTNTSADALPELVLRLYPNGGKSYGDGRLDVQAVTVNGQAVTPAFSLQDSVLSVPLAAPLAPGAQVVLGFDWQGRVPRDFAGEEGYGIYSLSDDFMALAGWFPLLAVYENGAWRMDPVSNMGDSVYSEIAEYRVEIRAPLDYTLAATGSEIARQEADGEQVVTLDSGPVRDFFIIAAKGLIRSSQSVAGVQVNAYVLPAFEELADQAAAIAAEALEIYNTRFGPYPYPELDVVQAPMKNAGGVEFPGIVLIEEGRYDGPKEPEFTVTIAHEVAHQWWYGVVGNDVFLEPWLDEALATYSAALYYEFSSGKSGYDQSVGYWQESYATLRRTGTDEAVSGTLSHFEQTGGAYGPVVYSKGALFFHVLRQQIGDPAFFEALRRYYSQQQFRLARGRDLLALFEETSGQDLEPLYQEWLYGP